MLSVLWASASHDGLRVQPHMFHAEKNALALNKLNFWSLLVLKY